MEMVYVFLLVVLYLEVSVQYSQMSIENLVENLQNLETELESSCEHVRVLERDMGTMTAFQRRLTLTEDDLRRAERDIRRTEREIGYLKTRKERDISSLEERVRNLEQGFYQFNAIGNRLDNMELVVDNLKRKVDQVTARNAELLPRPVKLQQNPSPSSNSYVYFSAYTTRKIEKYEGYIGYDVVDADYGAGFNKHTGLFTAPLDGLYLFTFHAECGENALVVLIKNQNEEKVRTLSSDEVGFGEDVDKQVDIVTTMELQKGDHVGCYTFDNRELRGNSAYNWDLDKVIVKLTIFQGYLLR